MAKQKINIPSIYEVGNHLKPDTLLPVYYFSGTDLHTIDSAVNAVVDVVEPMIDSEFDKETVSADKNLSAREIVNQALAFPFGNGKKLLIVKNFEKVKDKKILVTYLKDSADFTVLIFTHIGKITSPASEPFKTLLSKNFLFEAKELKGADLVRWVIKDASKYDITISKYDAEYLVDLVGEDKSLIEMQLQKLADYIGGKGEINKEVIDKLVAETKEYTIFQLQDALGQGNKERSLAIIYNLIENGKDIAFINTMLIKFITTIAKSTELSRENLDIYKAGPKAKVSPYYYKNVIQARFFLSDKKLITAARAIYNAEIRLKTTSIDSFTNATLLIGEMFS